MATMTMTMTMRITMTKKIVMADCYYNENYKDDVTWW